MPGQHCKPRRPGPTRMKRGGLVGTVQAVIEAHHGVRGLLHDVHVELLAAREDVIERSH